MEADDVECLMNELQELNQELKSRLAKLSRQELMLQRKEKAMLKSEQTLEEKGKILEEKDEALRKREVFLLDIEKSIHAIIDLSEVNRSDSQKLESFSKENRRLKDSFTTVCSYNMKLKKQLEDQQQQCCTMKKQLNSLNARLSGLRTVPCLDSHSNNTAEEEIDQAQKCATQSQHKAELNASEESVCKRDCVVREKLLHHLLQWVSKNLTALHRHRSVNLTSDKLCGEILPLMATLLPNLPTQRHHIFLQIICQIIQHMNSEMKILLSTTLRRLGKTCATRDYRNSFSGSSDTGIRVMCSVLILQTLTQVDMLSQSLDNLREDLWQPEARNLFLSLDGVSVLLPFFKPSSRHQTICIAVLDIFILVASDSGLIHFLEQGMVQGLIHFLNKEWFKVATSLLTESVHTKLLEKLSIFLQRLSTLRESRELFEKSGALRLLQTQPFKENSFIHLNIVSILRNLKH